MMMKNTCLILLVLLGACAAPVSYVNNVPRSSGLEEGGDVNINVNVGSDVRVRDKTFQLGAAWSPVDNLGIAFEYSGHLRLEERERRHDKLNFLSGALIYYHPFTSGSSLEFTLGTGQGNVSGNTIDFANTIIQTENFQVDAKYRTYSFQANYNAYVPSESTRTSVGFRARQVNFERYSYIRSVSGEISDKSFSQDDWKVFILDPFLEVNQRISEKVRFNSRISYSFYNGEIRNEFKHPFYKKLGLSLGFQFSL